MKKYKRKNISNILAFITGASIFAWFWYLILENICI